MATTEVVDKTPSTGAPTPDRPTRRRLDLRERPQLWLVPTVFVVVVLAWEYGTQLLAVDEYVLPRPSQIVEALQRQLSDAQFWGHLWVTTQEALLGFAIGVGAAVLLGTFISQIKVVEATPYGEGSVRVSGAGTPTGYLIKGNEDSMLYHSPESPSYSVTIAEIWFADVESAEKAGFNRWDSGKSQREKK